MFIHSRLTQHVSGIIMPIVRRTDCIKPRMVLAWMCWLRLCGAGTRAERTAQCSTDLGHLYRIYSIPTHDKHQWLLLQFIALLTMDARGARNVYGVPAVVNKHKTARVASCWFIIYYRVVMHGNLNIIRRYVFKKLLNNVFKKCSQSLYHNDIHQKRSAGSQGSAYDDYHLQFTLFPIK